MLLLRSALLLLACAATAAAQPFAIDDAVSGGGPSADGGDGIALADDGSRYVVGTFEDTATFGDVSITSAGDSDIFLVKYDADLNAVWARRAGTDVFNDFGGAVAVAPDGSVYATGFFTGVATFDGGDNPDGELTTFSDFDAFLAKYTPDGDLEWVRQAGGVGQDTGRDVAVDAAGNVYLVGGFDGTGTFGTVTLQSAGSSDAFLAKYDSDGEVVWARRGGSDQGDLGYGVAVTDDGRAHVSGSFRGVALFGDLPIQSAGATDVFVAQYDADGTPVWVEGIGADGAEFTRGGGIGLDLDDNVYVQGSFSNTILIAAEVLVSQGFTDIFVAKLTSKGDEVWGRRGGGDGTNFSAALAVDASGNALATGYVDGTGTIADEPVTTQGRDGYLAVFDSEGDLVTVELLGGTGQDTGTGVAVNADRFAATGSFRGTASFGDLDLTSIGSSDVFVIGGPGEAAVPSTLFVDADATGAETGLSWADAFTDLQGALALAATLDFDSLAIWVAEGTYYPTDGDDRTASFELQSGLALFGGFNGTEINLDQRDPEANVTMLSGDIGTTEDITDNTYHVVVAINIVPATTLDGLVVAHGYADGQALQSRGGGVLILNSSVSFSHVIIEGNEAGERSCGECSLGEGGGIYISTGSNVEMTDVIFTGSQIAFRGRGGGLYNAGTLTLSGTAFLANSGSSDVRGSAMYNGGIATLNSVSFIGNRAGPSGQGAGLYNSGEIYMNDVLFEDNRLTSSGFVGGIYNSQGASSVIVNSTFLGNSGSLAGAMLNRPESEVIILDSHFIRNDAGNGAGLYNDEATVTILNSTFRGNTAGEAGGIVEDGSTSSYTNVLFAGNQGYGSAIRAKSGALIEVVNSTVVSNTECDGCSENGGAFLFSGNFGNDAAGATLSNVIIWGNVPNQIVEASTPLNTRHGIIQGGFAGTAILNADPLFVREPDSGPDGQWGTDDDDYGDLRPQQGSPAIDFGLAEFLPPDTFDLDEDGDTEEPLPVDLDGEARVQGNEVDLGAYESPFTVALEPGIGVPITSGLAAAYPNPFRNSTTLALDVADAQDVTVEVFDVLARRVATVHDGPLAVGAHRVVIEARGLPAGVYVVRVEGETFSQSQRVTVVR